MKSPVMDVDSRFVNALRAQAAMSLRKPDASPEADTGRPASPDITALSLDSTIGRQRSPSSKKKRRADSELHARRVKLSSIEVTIADPEFARNIPFTDKTNNPVSKPHDFRLYNHKQKTKVTVSPRQVTVEDSSDLSEDSLKPSAPRAPRQPGLIKLQKYDPRYPGLLLQPDSRPISQEQLASEIKSIYAGLTMVETKCIHVDRAQAAAPLDPTQKLAPDHWQALIALHRTLLHEHHDFFLASQHPSASPALRRLAAKYTMPASMWKHGTQAFLKLLRQKLPNDSLDYMLAFTYLAYQMIALLYENVPAFEDTWIERLGDLGRYRMTIEDKDVRNREIWACVARSWYSKAADKNPPVNRLYHHLAIWARPNALQQAYYYFRSLNAVEPFSTARELIITLFDPVIQHEPPVCYALPDTGSINVHADVYIRGTTDESESATNDFLGQLDNYIGRVTAKWKECDVYTAVTNIAEWFDHCVDLHILRQPFQLRNEQRKSTCFTDQQTANRCQNGSSLQDALQYFPDQNESFNVNGRFISAYAAVTTLFNALFPRSIIFAVFGRSYGKDILLGHIATWVVMAQIPTISASTTSPSPSPADAPGSTQETVFDWVMTGSMVLYVTIASLMNRRSRKCSLILMFTMGTLWLPATDEKSLDGIRETVLKGWFAGACHYVFQDCYTANDTTLHVVLYGILTALFASIGSNLPHSSLTKALPLSTALAAGILALLFRHPEPQRVQDPEQGIARPDRDG